MKLEFLKRLLGGARQERRFDAAKQTRLIHWTLGMARINGQLKQDYPTMVRRARDLAQNNDFVTGYLENLERNVIGPDGFRLQSLVRDASGAPDQARQTQIRELWEFYQGEEFNFVSSDALQGGREFDVLVLNTLVIDGEVFIWRRPDPASPFGIRYEVIDSLDVDYLYNVERTEDGGRIVMGVRIDARNRPVSYFVRESRSDFYQTGTRFELPASEVLHLFRKRFPGQVRGITRLAAAVLNIAQLDEYKEAEIIAAKLQSANCIIYEKTGVSDDLGGSANAAGDVMWDVAPGQAGLAPEGYTAKQITPNHPNSNFGAFFKAVLRGISNSVGLSYNKAAGDYESVNYSSLREASLEDRETYKTMQRFLIAKWKNPQFADFLRYSLLSGMLPGGFAELPRLLRHKFNPRRFSWVDPEKELKAKQIEFSLRLTDPLTEIEESGRDPVEVLDNWAIYAKMCADRGLSTGFGTDSAPPASETVDETGEGKQEGDSDES